MNTRTGPCRVDIPNRDGHERTIGNPAHPGRVVQITWVPEDEAFYLQLFINGNWIDTEDAVVWGVHYYEDALDAATFMVHNGKKPHWAESAFNMPF